MRRLKVILALALALAMMVTVSVAPAMAKDNDNDNQLDRKILHELRHDDFSCFGCGFNRFNHRFDDDFECCDDEDLLFTGFSPFLAGVPDIDVDTENVPNNSNLQGDCFVTDVDVNGDGFINDLDVLCFV